MNFIMRNKTRATVIFGLIGMVVTGLVLLSLKGKPQTTTLDMVGLVLDTKAPGCVIADSKGNPISFDSKVPLATMEKGSTFTGECLAKR